MRFGKRQLVSDTNSGGTLPETEKGCLILLRHGESTWNAENRFTGWIDVDLTRRGVEEARSAGRSLGEAGLAPDFAFTSYLRRAIRTLWIVLDEVDRMWIPQRSDWRLNERHYGALQGMDKNEARRRYGDDAIHRIRRGLYARPPLLDAASGSTRQRAEERIPSGSVPRGESLADTVDRVRPCWTDVIMPRVARGERVLVAAHGNSLRAMVVLLEDLAETEIEALEIPTGVPLIYASESDNEL